MEAKLRKMAPRPMVSMTTANCGWPMTRRRTTAVQRGAEERDDGDGQGQRHPVAEAEPDHEHVAGEGAQHEQVALGEVDQLGGLVDEDEARGPPARRCSPRRGRSGSAAGRCPDVASLPARTRQSIVERTWQTREYTLALGPDNVERPTGPAPARFGQGPWPASTLVDATGDYGQNRSVRGSSPPWTLVCSR